MRSFCFATTIFCILFAGAHVELAQADHITPDSNIHFEVWNGTAWVEIAPPAAASNPTGTYIIPERTSANPVPIGGGNSITVQKLNAAENIRVEWDDPLERLWLKNVKISTVNVTPIVDLRFRIWRNFTTSANEVGNMYYDARGGGWLKRANGASAVNAKIVIRGFIETPAGTGPNNSIKTLPWPPSALPCSPRPDKLVKCASPISSTISWNDFEKDMTPHSLANPDHMVTMEFWLTLPHGGGAANKDFLQLASTATGGIRLFGSSAPGAGGTEECDLCQGDECATCPDCGEGLCPDGSQCVTCVKESERSIFSKFLCFFFGNCPACIIPDLRGDFLRPDKLNK